MKLADVFRIAFLEDPHTAGAEVAQSADQHRTVAATEEGLVIHSDRRRVWAPNHHLALKKWHGDRETLLDAWAWWIAADPARLRAALELDCSSPEGPAAEWHLGAVLWVMANAGL